ncbi:MAG: hypothetical protein IJP39_11165 [Bacteroidales bacterium]|nr:hypothetical protein [Bacteroidales bacterium]
MDLSRIQQLIAKTTKAIEDNNRDLAEKLGWELCQTFEQDYDVQSEEDYTPSVALVQYEVMKVLLDLHIMRGDPIDIAIRGGQLLKKFKDDRDHIKGWKEEDWTPIAEIVWKSREATDEYYYGETLKAGTEEPARTPECKCLLCQKKNADKTGSHIVPHMLIARTFSYDGSESRDKAVVEESGLSVGLRDRFFGREVYDDAVEDLLGRGFTDEELEKEVEKPNALTRDYVFCRECEERFSVIESYYSDISRGHLAEYPQAVPYLFWLSVAWRMSVGGIGFKMTENHEEKLRKILDKSLALKREYLLLDQKQLGHCAYTLHRALDTRDETLGILAIHRPSKPYMALIDNLLFRFYASKSAAIPFEKRNGGNLEHLNTGSKKEVVTDIPFVDFWQVKREILDDNFEDERNVWNLGQPRNKTLSRVESVGEDGFSPEYTKIPNGMNTANDHVQMVPRAIRNINKWCEANPWKTAPEEISAGTGYSVEELYVILSYWEEKCNELEEKQKHTQSIAPLLNRLLEIL